MSPRRRPNQPGTARVRALTVVIAAVVLVAVWFVRQRGRPVDAGFRAPDFTVTDERGETVTLASFEGKVVLLNVWATWCGPCREEMPSMERLYDHFSGEDFEIAAISIDAPPDRTDAQGNPGGDPIAFARELGLTFPVLLDPSGEIQRTYRTAAVPESFLIGRDGVIYKKVAGATEWDSPTNVELVRRLVEGSEASGGSG
ncbi:MAG: TlpA family protein disulfide reductase [Gemmatimonadetes bacterium]|nr:TlpA family protein disulfide reductase [Gemmatimonadota bacterium]MYA64172.1 TlpA family protein disulfide reductase [Gemmatimonadota bacterium]MYB99420.1 TlpA family protein disulfide reductase [Gemmatimonadota bacterium]MYH53495.1 TlpA family protein disulfide reductase [Gemmatimonadota bacterium]MYI45733.1 TlpA family protein disulfide reductase [Gemmatimonadota bacterium]